MTGPYDDIINLQNPTSLKHPRMPAIDRAAQFSPFAALTGYSEAIKEETRLTDKKIELSEDEMTELERKLRITSEHMQEFEVVITYFQADQKKAGGSYVSTSGLVKKVDDYLRVVKMANGLKIPINDILQIESENFSIFL